MRSARRELMHAAVAGGGASVALMSVAINGADEEIPAAAMAALEPTLRAALLMLEAAGEDPDEHERARLKLAIEDYIETPMLLGPGRCRVCGCTDPRACTRSKDGHWFGPCAWTDASHSLCDNPDCLAAANVASARQPTEGATS